MYTYLMHSLLIDHPSTSDEYGMQRMYVVSLSSHLRTLSVMADVMN